MLIKNGNVLNFNRIEPLCDVRIQDGEIAELATNLRSQNVGRILDAEGCYVLPGLIDIHTHGLKNVLVDRGSLVDYARLQAEQGVTGCIPTLAGNPTENIKTMERGFRDTDFFRRSPNIIGFRPEIMYLADASAGSPESLAKISDETTQKVFKAGKGTIKIWDISPELDGAVSFIRWASQQNIITSMAHSNADESQIRRAVNAGMRLVTHFYDLFPMPEEIDEGVYPTGVTDYINIEDRLTVEIIPDGVHVHPYLVEKSLRCKGLERVIFITDSVPGAGNRPGMYDGLYDGVSVEVTENRGVRRVSDDLLSGSALTQINGFRNTVYRYGKSIVDASRLCSYTAAKLLGLRSKGYLAPGMDADIIIMDKNLDLKTTVIRGEITFES